MKKKNGFTLIELLAIIVILAIIAVITVPIILNIIDNANTGAVKDSAYGYKDAINKFYVSKLSQDKDFQFDDKVYTASQLKTEGVSVSGKEPGGNSWVQIQNNEVVNGCLQFDEYKVDITNGQLGNVSKGECEDVAASYRSYVAAKDTDTHMGTVYMNPADSTVECNAITTALNVNDNGTPTGIYQGCMKFYIYDDNGDGTVDMILDHNISGNVPWNSSGISGGMNEVATVLGELTSGWIGNPRLIRADEVAHIVGADRNDTIRWDKTKFYDDDGYNYPDEVSWFYLDGSGKNYSSGNGWHRQVLNSDSKSRYAWLFDYTSNCANYGCNFPDDYEYNPVSGGSFTGNKLIKGYYTSDVIDGGLAHPNNVWRVAALVGPGSANTNYYGIRPVITVSKTTLGIN